MGGAAVGEVVAAWAGDDRVGEVEGLDAARDLLWFVGVWWVWCAVVDVAVAAVSGAGVTEDEEGGGAGVEAFGDVGAFGFFAYCMQSIYFD